MKINTLNEAIGQLTHTDLTALTYAFENGCSHVVFLENGYFIAVHSNVPALEKHGAWTFGQMPKGE